jgi:hypothetical protein
MTTRPRKTRGLPATLRPGDFPLGSVQSRAVARALADYDGDSRSHAQAIIEYIGSPEKTRTILVPRELAGLRLQFQPKQAAFDVLLELSLASWNGYGGSRGAAKSGYIRRGMLRRRLEYPGTSGADHSPCLGGRSPESRRQILSGVPCAAALLPRCRACQTTTTNLGPHQETLRQYLHGETGFPAGAGIVTLCTDLLGAQREPPHCVTSSREARYHLHSQ